MNKLYALLIISLSTIVSTAHAQTGDSWKIFLNKTLLIQTPVEANEPIIRIAKASTRTKNTISIQYKSGDTESDFKRSFYINDASEKTIKKVDLKGIDGTITINSMDLKAAAAAGKPLFIYTMAIPKDPALAAAVRVRRFLLCKIEWK
jgi:hypothetical protein